MKHSRKYFAVGKVLGIGVVMLTADGCQEVTALPDTGCCPPPLCGNALCCTFVAFFQMLPSGPLWDMWKAKAIDYFQRSSDLRQCPLLTDPDCPSLMLHAIYSVLKLRKLVSDALWPALRESDPMTAVSTLDEWLARLQWEDCFLQACRSRLLGGITPYEIMSDCGPLFCPPNFPPELTAALKHNIVRALTRANMGVIKNLCGLSWVIEPLGAEVRPVLPYMTAPVPVNWCDPGCPSGMKLMVVATRDWIEGAGTGDLCESHPLPRVNACFDRGCDLPAGLPSQIWPGLLAAECIIRSLAANMVCKQEFITLVAPPCFQCPTIEPVPPEVLSDPYFAWVMLLCGFDGIDGSTAFVDEGPQHRPIASTAPAQIDTARSKFGSSSLMLDGSAAVVYVPNSTSVFTSDFNLTGVSWTFETFVMFRALTGDQTIFGQWFPPSEGYLLRFYAGSLDWNCYGGTNFSAAWSPVIDTWYWVTISFNGDKCRLRIDGVMVASVIGPQDGQSSAVLFATGAQAGAGNAGRYFNGWRDEFRYSKGFDRYDTDANVPVPILPFPRS